MRPFKPFVFLAASCICLAQNPPLAGAQDSAGPVQSLAISVGIASPDEPPFPIEKVPAPLFDDPIWHGAADPTIVWSPFQKEWRIYYTQRRATLPNAKGVEWAHGSAIGIASSKDGASWKYEGICKGDEGLGTPVESNCSWWAPCVFFHDGQLHMFVAYVDGVYQRWEGKRFVKHFTSNDGQTWKFQMTLPLSSENCIDPCVYPINGKWIVWYKDEAHASNTCVVESPDLKTWKQLPTAVADICHEAPQVWHWKGAYWMIVDGWEKGLRIYRSEDGLSDWKFNNAILLAPGKRAKDTERGGHPAILEQGERAFVVYHVGGGPTILQAAELELNAEGKIVCDRDKHAAVQQP